ncbi:MAG: SMC domain-containing protein [Candidatus Magnetoglobus multicellularis str. Araruama]|uniref:SMC domain-containing protein n=1 Tax=Candidatus Magnetoglobus multicellularis str. Araruama TaxID=890399 RepID=A0A1V1NV23_9BACT|nr:MAG: SMC domain-containing protein [Candidatus Magnetoglobus multicellularis str. Araruama]
MLTNEAFYNLIESQNWQELGNNIDNCSLLKQVVKRNTLNSQNCKHIFDTILSWGIYHFHDTSEHAAMRHYEIIQDNKALRFKASNIAPYLLRLKNDYQSIYQEIINAIQMVLPFFEDFLLDITSFGEKQKVNLSWVQKGSDFPMQPYHFSDGSIRFICLATALLQPAPPSTIIIDEPELGLHPSAIAVLAELIQNTAKRTQLIIATQSPTLIDHFGISDIIVVNRESGASTFNRLKEKEFNVWLENYSVGELWCKNVITGGPVYE